MKRFRAGAAITALAMATTLARPARADPDPPQDHGWDAIALPVVNYNTDLGLGLGLAGGAYIYGPGYRPYRYSFGAHPYFTTPRRLGQLPPSHRPGLLR